LVLAEPTLAKVSLNGFSGFARFNSVSQFMLHSFFHAVEVFVAHSWQGLGCLGLHLWYTLCLQ
jgi:hypothetical protein